jgi:hypothetical protein
VSPNEDSSDSDERCRKKEDCANDTVEEKDGERNRESGTRVITRERRIV